MIYNNDCTLPKEYLEQLTAEGLKSLPDMMCVLVNQAMQIKISRYLSAKPYERSHERLGHAHGLIRQYYSKGADFTDLTDRDIERVMLRLSHRPRKCLGHKISSVVFLKN